MKTVYVAYPFVLAGTKQVTVFKEKFKREGYKVLDPYERAGVGYSPTIAEKDLALIDQADLFVAYLPVNGTQTGMELMYAFLKGKKIRVYTELDGPFFSWLEKKGVYVRGALLRRKERTKPNKAPPHRNYKE